MILWGGVGVGGGGGGGWNRSLSIHLILFTLEAKYGSDPYATLK